MKTLYFSLQSDLKLMVIPDNQAHLDGHTIITPTYGIFRDTGMGNPLLAKSKEYTPQLGQPQTRAILVISLLKKRVRCSAIRQTESRS